MATSQYVIKITSYGFDEHNYALIAWEVSNYLYRKYGIDVLVEYENAALTDYLSGVGLGMGVTPVLVLEAGDMKKEIINPDLDEFREAMEDLLLKSMVNVSEVRVKINNKMDMKGRDPISFTAAS